MTSLPGIGPRLGKLVEKLAGPLVVDLLWHLPFAVVDRRNAPEVAHAKAGEIATLTVTVDEHLVPRNPRQPYRVWCSDETGRLCLTYFNGREDYLKKLLPVGRGPRGERQGRDLPGRGADDAPRPCRAARPARVDPAGRAGLRPDRRPHPATGPEGDRRRRRARARAAGMAGRGLLARNKWTDWHTALARAHAPADETDLSPLHPARARLAFDELLASQLAIALVRHHNRTVAGHATTGDGRLRDGGAAPRCRSS